MYWILCWEKCFVEFVTNASTHKQLNREVIHLLKLYNVLNFPKTSTKKTKLK